MSFVGRARSSFERGDTLRAVLTLVAGLRRKPDHPDANEAVELLVELVRDEVDSGGIEHEIADVLVPLRSRNELLATMVGGLREREQDKIADRLVIEAERRGLKFVEPAPPAPRAEPEAEPEPEPELEPEPEPAQEPIDDGGPDEGDAAEEARPATARETTSEERERRKQETANAEARLSERKRQAIEQRQAELAAKRRRRTVQVVIVALIVGVAFVGVYVAGAASRSSDLTTVERALQRFNRFDDATMAKVAEATAARDEPEFSERLAFAQALSGEPVEVRLEGWSTSWGLAAAVVSALNADDLESALALVTKIERTDPASLGADFSRALLEEYRGNGEEARAAAARVTDRYADFTPAHEITIRSTARQLELEQMAAAVQQLQLISPKHPYAAMATLPDPRHVLLGPLKPTPAPPAIDTKDEFLQAAHAYHEAVAAASRGDIAAGSALARKAVEADPRMLPARLLLATSLVSVGTVDEAVAEFEKAAESAHSTHVRLLIQATAPIALTGAGRADLAARFTTPYPKLRADGVDDQFDERVGTTRPEPLRKPALNDVARVPFAAEALYARAHVLAEQGDVPAARAMLADLVARNITPGRGKVMLAALNAGVQSDDVVSRLGAAYNTLYLDFTLPSDWVPPVWAAPLVAFVRARFAVALDRPGAALRVVDEAALGIAYQPVGDALRMLAWARRGPKSGVYEKLSQRFAHDDVKSASTAVLVAEALFWQRHFTEFEKWLQRAEKLGALPRDVAWICALTNIGRGRDEEAAACLEAYPVAQIASAQAALGFVQLELGRPKTARKHFEAALAIDASFAPGAAGLGEALVDDLGKGAKAAIDKARGGLEGASRAELDRWYAVALGSRKGEEGALEPLEAAAKVLIDQTDLDVERAAYHAAREEWGPAEQFYESALRRDDTLAEAHIAVARIKLRGDGDGARKHLTRYLELEPQGTSAAWARQQLE